MLSFVDLLSPHLVCLEITFINVQTVDDRLWTTSKCRGRPRKKSDLCLKISLVFIQFGGIEKSAIFDEF